MMLKQLPGSLFNTLRHQGDVPLFLHPLSASQAAHQGALVQGGDARSKSVLLSTKHKLIK